MCPLDIVFVHAPLILSLCENACTYLCIYFLSPKLQDRPIVAKQRKVKLILIAISAIWSNPFLHESDSLPPQTALWAAGTPSKCTKLSDGSTPLLAASSGSLEVRVDTPSVASSCLYWSQNQIYFDINDCSIICVSACEPMQTGWVYPDKLSDIYNT